MINNIRKTDIIFIVILLLAFKVGSYIMTAAFFGTVSLIGLIVMIEAIPPLKWVLSRSTRVIDVVIFLFTILATMNYGLNISASLTVMGLGYTLCYAPRLRADRLTKKKSKPIGNYKSKFNAK